MMIALVVVARWGTLVDDDETLVARWGTADDVGQQAHDPSKQLNGTQLHILRIHTDATPQYTY